MWKKRGARAAITAAWIDRVQTRRAGRRGSLHIPQAPCSIAALVPLLNVVVALLASFLLS